MPCGEMRALLRRGAPGEGGEIDRRQQQDVGQREPLAGEKFAALQRSVEETELKYPP